MASNEVKDLGSIQIVTDSTSTEKGAMIAAIEAVHDRAADSWKQKGYAEPLAAHQAVAIALRPTDTLIAGYDKPTIIVSFRMDEKGRDVVETAFVNRVLNTPQPGERLEVERFEPNVLDPSQVLTLSIGRQAYEDTAAIPDSPNHKNIRFPCSGGNSRDHINVVHQEGRVTVSIKGRNGSGLTPLTPSERDIFFPPQVSPVGKPA